MFPVQCSQCGRKSFSAGIPRCFHCGHVETRTDADANFIATEKEAPRQLGRASGSKNHVHPKDTHLVEVVSTKDRKTFQPDDRMVMDNNEDKRCRNKDERCRNKNGSIRGYALPTCSEQGGMNNDLTSEIRKTRHMEVDEFRQQGNIKKAIQQCSLPNLKNFQRTKNENLESKISNFETSKSEGMHSIANFYAVPGPSGFHDSKNTSNLSSEEFPSRSALELQPAVETDENISLCTLCRWELVAHDYKVEGKFLYKCCECQKVFSTTFDLQKHTNMHCPRLLPCNICGEFIFENDAHGSEETCNVCLEKFQCRTQLAQHSVVHKDYYASNCRICGTKIDGRFDPVKNVYNCCHCHYSNPLKTSLQSHLYIHTNLKVSKCDVCGRRFKSGHHLNQHLSIHFRCNLCANSFKNKELLEIHLKAEHTQP